MTIEAASSTNSSTTSTKLTSEEMEAKQAREKFARGLHMEIMNKKVGDILSDIEQAEQIVVTKATEKVEAVDKKLTSLTLFEANTLGLKTVGALFNGRGVGVQAPGAFGEPDVYIISGNENALSMTATADALPDEIKVTVNQIAKMDTVVAGSSVADATVAAGWAGNLKINNQTITFTADQTLTQLKATINNASVQTGVTAYITKTDGGSLLSFKANSYAQPIVVDSTGITFSGTGSATQVPSSAGTRSVPDLSTTPLGWDGDIVINGQTINLNPGFTANDLKDTINLSTPLSGVTASLLAGTTGYFFSFESASTTPAVVNTSGLTFSSLAGNINQIPRTSTPTADQLSAKVIFRDTGQVKTYTTNTITDQAPGITFNLKAMSSYPDSVTLGIRYNASTPTTILLGKETTDATGLTQKSELDKGFVDKWNDYIDFMKSKEAFPGQLTNELQNSLRLAFIGTIPGILNTELNTADKVGIAVATDGKMTVDKSLWTTNIESKFEQVKNALGFNWSLSDSSFQLMQRPKILNSDISGNDITVSIQKAADGTLSATMKVGSKPTVNCTIGGTAGNAVVIEGLEGSEFEDVKLVFSEVDRLTAGGAARTSTLKMTQGFMDRFAGTMEGFFETDVGFPKTRDDLTAEKDAKEVRVQDLLDKKEQRMERTRAKFARLEVVYLQLKAAQDYVKTHQMTAFAAAA